MTARIITDADILRSRQAGALIMPQFHHPHPDDTRRRRNLAGALIIGALGVAVVAGLAWLVQAFVRGVL
jgi:hypothetical protein